jgi:hypothetical protein
MKTIEQLWLIIDPSDHDWSTYLDKTLMLKSASVARGGIPRSFVPGLPKNVWAQNVLDAFQTEEAGCVITEGGEQFDTHTTPFVVRCHVRYDFLEVGRGEGKTLPEARLLAARAIWTPELAPLEPED